jgi:hypothetical protein
VSKFDTAFSNLTTVTSLLDIVCIIWTGRGIEIAKPENESYRNLLQKKGAGMLSSLFKFYKVGIISTRESSWFLQSLLKALTVLVRLKVIHEVFGVDR